MPADTDSTLSNALDHDTVAVVGCSTTPGKAAHDVPKYLLDRGYNVIPVNPFAEEIFGRQAHDSIDEVPGTVGVVNVFRPSEEVPGIVEDALERDDVRVLWLQLGISHDEAAATARKAGLDVVQDRCIKIEHARLS